MNFLIRFLVSTSFVPLVTTSIASTAFTSANALSAHAHEKENTRISNTRSASSLIDLSAHGVRVYKPAQNTAPALTKKSVPVPRDVVTEFLSQKGVLLSPGLRSSSRASLSVAKEFLDPKTRMTHLKMTQEFEGLAIYGTYVKAAINPRGDVVHLIENIVKPRGRAAASAISAEQALQAALDKHYPKLSSTPSAFGVKRNTTSFVKGDFFYAEPTVTKVAVPMRGGLLEEGFLVKTWDLDNMLRHTVVSRFGRILAVEVRTNHDSYNIFPDSPDNTTQEVVNGPGGGNAESPVGWVFSDTTTGNNVDAYLDRDANNLPDIGSRPISTTQDFLALTDLSEEPTTPGNQQAAVQNLFYFNNFIHDVLYKHGFVEGVGNFQEDNFGLGGLGGDSVNAEAQDGSGFNNANFATPSDGINPRMQMFIWNQASPNRGSDLDSDIIWHEYGHGLTWRMIGSMGGRLSGAIGEGMSDVLAILMNEDDVVGEWSFNNANGIRRFPYTDYPLTYGNVLGSSVHNDGEIYAATIWRLWELWQQNDLSKDVLMDYLVGGMNFTPSNPSYEHMRDGILSAISDTSEQCLVWEAFAQFGIGDGASGVDAGSVTITESFLLPPLCQEDDPIPPAAITDLSVVSIGTRSAILSWRASGDDGLSGNATAYDVRFSNTPITEETFDLAQAATGLPQPSAPGTLETGEISGLSSGSEYYFAIKALDNVSNAGAISNIVSTTTLPELTIFSDDLENGIGNWTIDESLWHLANHRFNSATTAFYYGIDSALNYNTGGTNSGEIISRTIDLSSVTETLLTFSHYIETENLEPYDTSSVAVSTDGGVSWDQVFATSFSTGAAGMVEQSIDLSAFDGEIIQLRFRFDTVDGALNNFEGWVIDDINVSGLSTGENLEPTGVTGGPYFASPGQQVLFDSSGSFDPEGQPLTYFWDFGDGGSSTETNPSYIYSVPGVYPVELIVSDGETFSEPESTTVTVELPVANPGGNYQGGVTQPIAFDGSVSSGISGTPLNFFWDFGDGNNASGESPIHSYDDEGLYTVTLIVEDGFSASEPSATLVSVSLPVANAGGPYEQLVGSLVNFDGSASVGSSGNMLNYIWEFGDGGTATGATPSYSYASEGSYTASLIVEDGYFPSDPAIFQVNILPPPNVPPVISSVSASPEVILDTEVSQLNVVANDENLDSLSYTWTVASELGEFDNSSSASPVFTPSNVDADTEVLITVDVSDGQFNVSQTIAVTVQDGGSGEPGILLDNNFDEGDITAWSIIDQGTLAGPSNWGVIDGSFAQSSNIYSTPTNAAPEKLGTYARYNDGTDWSNYRVNFTMSSGDNDALGMMFRVQDSDNYYRFSWDRQRSYRRLIKRVEGVTTILQEDSVPYNADTSYKVTITAQDNFIEVRIDNVVVLSAIDAEFIGGTIALYTWANTGTRFDDLLVEELSGGNIAPSITSVIAAPSSILDTATSQLSVSASDVDTPAEQLTYSWTLPQGSGSLDDVSLANPVFTPADVGESVDVVLTVQVSDGNSTVSESVSITVQDADAPPALLATDFENGNLDNWTATDEGSVQGPSAWSAQSGSLVQSSNIYSSPTGAEGLEKEGTYLQYDGGINWTDYRSTFTMSSGDNDALGFMFRVQDSNNYYRFSWDLSRSYRRLVKRVNGVTTLLASDAVPYTLGQSYDVDIAVVGNQIDVVIDGETLFSVTDNDLLTGSVAFYCWGNVNSVFDDLIVEDIN